MPEPVASQKEGLPIFESVESEYLGAHGANLVPGTMVHRSATAAVSAQIARTRLTSFQQGSRRARAEAQIAREAERTRED